MNQGSTSGVLRSLPGRVVAASMVMLAGCGALAGCGSDAPELTDASRAQIAQLWVEQEAWGGLSEQGAPFARFTVDGSEGWTVTTLEGERHGTLQEEDLVALVEAVRGTALLDADGDPPCESAFDGMDVAYRWTVDGATHEVTSCDVAIPADDPLVVTMTRLAERFDANHP